MGDLFPEDARLVGCLVLGERACLLLPALTGGAGVEGLHPLNHRLRYMCDGVPKWLHHRNVLLICVVAQRGRVLVVVLLIRVQLPACH